MNRSSFVLLGVLFWATTLLAPTLPANAQAPYGGTAAAIPGTVSAANYDTGGQGVAYNVTSTNGSANSYRSDGIDLETTTDSGGVGYNLGWTATGQWFKYTVNVASAGTYTLSARVAAAAATGTTAGSFYVQNSSGTNLTGTINVPGTGGWQTWTTITANITLPAGQQTLEIYQSTGGYNFHWFQFAAKSSGEAPYGGTAAAIPGTVQAENYDTGGQGVGYNVTSTNGSDNGYRSDGVDLEVCTDTGGGVNLGWTAAGQWFRYTVNVSTAGTYTVTYRVSNGNTSNGSFHIQNSSGTNLSGSITVAPTGGWQTWTSVSGSITLPAGQQVLTVYQDTANFNINYISFASGASCTAKPSAPSGLSASNTTSSGTTLSWNAVTAPSGCSISGYTVYQGGTSIATVSSGTSYTVGGLSASTTYSFTVAANDSAGVGSQSSTVSVTTSGSGGGVTTTGSISFHVSLGVNNNSETLTLTGGNFNDLIESNFISGAMYAHMVEEFYPGIQFNKDYLIGSDFAQLLQENIETYDYVDTGETIDPSPDQAAVFGVGQGGPYQINDYAYDMVGGGTAPVGHSLINYIAVQKNIGYTMANASTQYEQTTPSTFNDKYYGPMLPAFFHYNDMVALNVIGKGPGGWTTPWEPAYDNCLANFVNLPNNFLEMILNVAYNQGYYGGLVNTYSVKGETATASTVASVDSYSSVWGDTITYDQYPYQVHYYLDQLYDNPIPTTSPTVTTTPANHVAVPISQLETVFSNVFQKLDYSNGTNAAVYFTASQATSAFTSALSTYGVSSTATYDLSNASNRSTIYNVLDKAISNLESTSGMKFNATTTNQL